MALSKSENRQFGDKCLPHLVRSVATDFGFAGRSQAKGEEMMVELGDISI